MSKPFDPRKYTWHFVSYYKYQFTFACDQKPMSVTYGGDADEIYRFDVDTVWGHSWSEITGGECDTDEQIEAAREGTHDLVDLN